MELLGDIGHVESHLVRLEMVLVLVQDRCTVCKTGARFMPIVPLAHISFWTHPMEASFGPFGDSANLDAR